MANEAHNMPCISRNPQHEESATAHTVSSRPSWHQEGPFILDAAGRKVARMEGDPAEYGWQQRRILAAVNAFQDTPTHFIEEMLEKCDDNIILALITHDRSMAATLQSMEQRIAAHRREIDQLREIMEACRMFEEQRTFEAGARSSRI